MESLYRTPRPKSAIYLNLSLSLSLSLALSLSFTLRYWKYNCVGLNLSSIIWWSLYWFCLIQLFDISKCINLCQFQVCMHQYPLHRISYCADDKTDKRMFTFIAKAADSNSHYCYVFDSEKCVSQPLSQFQSKYLTYVAVLIVVDILQ